MIGLLKTAPNCRLQIKVITLMGYIYLDIQPGPGANIVHSRSTSLANGGKPWDNHPS
jgi:hypothetical protein